MKKYTIKALSPFLIEKEIINDKILQIITKEDDEQINKAIEEIKTTIQYIEEHWGEL